MHGNSTISWESVGDDPMVRDLALRMAGHSGKREPEQFLSRLRDMARDISLPGVLAVAREPLDEQELVYSTVKGRVRVFADKHTPRWALCTAGTTSLEISPNGFYGRCPKTAAKREYLGDIRDEGPLKVLQPAHDELGCTIPCKQMMCFGNNVLRGTDQADFARRVDRQGLRGDYRQARRGYHSKIFIRWKVTDVCNYTCAYCCDWRTVNAKGVEVTDAELMAAAGRIVGQFDAISMRLTGGEPSARRCYLDLMRLFHANLDRFTDIEIRTNLSYQAKHKEVLGWDWNGKLHLHVGCHIRDKSFMPWRTVEVLQSAPNADYVLKFVSMPAIRHHVQYFRRYFVDSGIPPAKIKIIEENSGRDDTYWVDREEAPPARKALEERTKAVASAAEVPAPPAPPAIPPNAAARLADTDGSTNVAVTRFTMTELRAIMRRRLEHFLGQRRA